MIPLSVNVDTISCNLASHVLHLQFSSAVCQSQTLELATTKIQSSHSPPLCWQSYVHLSLLLLFYYIYVGFSTTDFLPLLPVLYCEKPAFDPHPTAIYYLLL